LASAHKQNKLSIGKVSIQEREPSPDVFNYHENIVDSARNKVPVAKDVFGQ
jgi:hypothetical protein